MKNDVSDVERRVKRYWFTDGIVEIVGGGLSFLFGTYFIAQEMLAEGSAWHTVLGGAFVLLLVSGYFITRSLVNNLKTRITYPRTGYVDYPSQKGTALRRIFHDWNRSRGVHHVDRNRQAGWNIRLGSSLHWRAVRVCIVVGDEKKRRARAVLHPGDFFRCGGFDLVVQRIGPELQPRSLLRIGGHCLPDFR